MQLEEVQLWGHLEDGKQYLVKVKGLWRTAFAKIVHPDIMLKSGTLTLYVGDVLQCYKLPEQSSPATSLVCKCGHASTEHDEDGYCNAIGCVCARLRLQGDK